MICPLCDTPVDVAELDTAHPIGTAEGVVRAHRECLLRCVAGGIGHLEDHDLWCVQMRDPDGGLSYRESAIRVDEWLQRYGFEAAVRRPVP